MDTRHRLLLIKQILEDTCDAEQGITMDELMDILGNRYGEAPDIKSVYQDIKALNTPAAQGVPVALDVKAPRGGGEKRSYLINSRTFSIDELKLLVNSVQSSKYLTDKQCHDLVEKIATLCSERQAQELRTQTIITNRLHSVKDDDKIIDTLNTIQKAIASNQQITFQYYEYVLKSNKPVREFKYSGKNYILSPWMIIFADGFYYLKAYDNKAKKLFTYRVDRMAGIHIVAAEREGLEAAQEIDTKKLTQYTFNMYSGEVIKVDLLCKNSLLKTIIDKFGESSWLLPAGGTKGYFKTTVSVAISPAFFGWIAGLEGAAKITGPQTVVEEYKAFLTKLMGQYK